MRTYNPSVYIYAHLDFSDTRLEEMEMPEDRVLEKLNTVSTAKRLANMVCKFCPNKSKALLRDAFRNSVILILENEKRFTELKGRGEKFSSSSISSSNRFLMSSCRITVGQRWTCPHCTARFTISCPTIPPLSWASSCCCCQHTYSMLSLVLPASSVRFQTQSQAQQNVTCCNLPLSLIGNVASFSLGYSDPPISRFLRVLQ